MQAAVQQFAVMSFMAVGLSHMLQPKAWARLFIALRRQGEAGCLANGLLHLVPGALIVAGHNVWQGIPAVLTVFGHALVLKATVYLLCPRLGLAALSRVSVERSWEFVAAGALLLGLGGLLLLSS